MADSEERGFLKALKENTKDATTRMAYADWLEEHQQRVKAGVSEARYRLRRKSDGLFFEAYTHWTARGRHWRTLSAAKAYLNSWAGYEHFNGTPWSEIEIDVVEVRTQVIASLSISQSGGNHPWRQGGGVIIHEPMPSETPALGEKN
jgi:uncharacterized protein (TIGR02996 family)